jgi:hypothetical protein
VDLGRYTILRAPIFCLFESEHGQKQRFPLGNGRTPSESIFVLLHDLARGITEHIERLIADDALTSSSLPPSHRISDQKGYNLGFRSVCCGITVGGTWTGASGEIERGATL